ncbi:MAG: hypothetical protein ACRC28_02185, partial [Clostridium sp.]|uniref:hypothetical protein n=1 Tax=Clostridium sp. TaxID=1506 RepID=UPI003F3E1956
TDSRHIYLRESHTRFLTERVVSLLESKDKGILSDKWVFKISNKLFTLMNPNKKLLKQIKKATIL